MPKQTDLQYRAQCDNYLGLFESLKEVNELNPFHSSLENNSASTCGDMFVSDQLLDCMNF